MLNFEFYNPTKIIFGKNTIKDLDLLVDKKAKVLIVYGKGSVKKYGTLERVKSALEGREIFEFEGVEPNPRYETLMKAVEVVKKEDITFILGVGGGSVMDGTKFINLAANYKGKDKTDLLKGEYEVESVIDMGMVLTLPATGSEMNCGAVISYGDGKFPVKHILSYPKFSILDPEITYTLPKKQIANGIVDSFVHVTEQYLTYPAGGIVQDRMAEGILLALKDIADKTLNNPTDYEARSNLVWSSTLALNGLIGKGVPQDWMTHVIGHEITALYGVDHGQTLAIILPAVMDIRRKQKGEKIVQYGARVFGIKTGNIDEIIKATREFFNSLGLKTKLSDYGIKEEAIEKICNNLISHKRDNLSETGDVTTPIIREILKKAF